MEECNAAQFDGGSGRGRVVEVSGVAVATRELAGTHRVGDGVWTKQSEDLMSRFTWERHVDKMESRIAVMMKQTHPLRGSGLVAGIPMSPHVCLSLRKCASPPWRLDDGCRGCMPERWRFKAGALDRSSLVLRYYGGFVAVLDPVQRHACCGCNRLGACWWMGV